MDDVSRKLITEWMKEVEAAMREMLFAISQGHPLPKNAEAFEIIRHGLDNMQEICNGLT